MKFPGKSQAGPAKAFALRQLFHPKLESTGGGEGEANQSIPEGAPRIASEEPKRQTHATSELHEVEQLFHLRRIRFLQIRQIELARPPGLHRLRIPPDTLFLVGR